MNTITALRVALTIVVIVLGVAAVATAETSCYFILAEWVSHETVVALQAEGWAGDPTDSMEALWSPGCW